jgi:hypothetical protein
MALLVVGDVMNVLRKIGIDSPQSFGVDSIAASSRNFAIPDSSQFVILVVKVSLKGFSCGQEPQDGGIAFREAAASLRQCLCSAHQQAGTHGCPSRC